MSQGCSYSGCVYFDANIINMAVEHPEWNRPLFNFLFKNNLCIAFSDALLVELSQASKKHDEFNTFFTVLPSAKIKSFEVVIDEEVNSYPKTRTDTLVLPPASSESGKQTIANWLSSDEIKEARRKQLLYAENIKQHLESVKSNFPPSTQGKYNKGQTEMFAWLFSVQWLRKSHPDFMKKLIEHKRLLKAEVFPSIQLLAYYVYYKYYLGSKQIGVSDFGDLFHLFYFPYCKLIILESDMYIILNEYRSRSKMLDPVEIANMNFFKKICDGSLGPPF
jgi:hypothetical protein